MPLLSLGSEMHAVTIKTTAERATALMNLINTVSGVENMRVLIPLYDDAMAAIKELEAALAAGK